MAAVVKSIAIGKKDAILAKWRLKVQEQEERLQSFLIKQALLKYYKDGTYLEIGRIHFNPNIDVAKYYNSTKGKSTINLWLDDSPELIEWIEILESKKLKVTKVFKDILQHCITIIPEDEEEFIPSYYDIVLNSNNKDSTIPTLKENEQENAKNMELDIKKTNNVKPLKAQKTQTASITPIAKKEGDIEKSKNTVNILGLGVKR